MYIVRKTRHGHILEFQETPKNFLPLIFGKNLIYTQSFHEVSVNIKTETRGHLGF